MKKRRKKNNKPFAVSIGTALGYWQRKEKNKK